MVIQIKSWACFSTKRIRIRSDHEKQKTLSGFPCTGKTEFSGEPKPVIAAASQTISGSKKKSGFNYASQ